MGEERGVFSGTMERSRKLHGSSPMNVAASMVLGSSAPRPLRTASEPERERPFTPEVPQHEAYGQQPQSLAECLGLRHSRSEEVAASSDREAPEPSRWMCNEGGAAAQPARTPSPCGSLTSDLAEAPKLSEYLDQRLDQLIGDGREAHRERSPSPEMNATLLPEQPLQVQRPPKDAAEDALIKEISRLCASPPCGRPSSAVRNKVAAAERDGDVKDDDSNVSEDSWGGAKVLGATGNLAGTRSFNYGDVRCGERGGNRSAALTGATLDYSMTASLTAGLAATARTAA